MFQAHELVEIKSNPKISDFGPGDTVKVGIRVREGDRVRTQIFEGVVIRKRGGGPSATFTVRRITHGIGVERTFHLYSPVVEHVEVSRRGAVRRADSTTSVTELAEKHGSKKTRPCQSGR